MEWNKLTLSGLNGGDRFGKPGYWHFIFVGFYIFFSLMPRIWAKQWNLLISAMNIAWMVRNFFALAVCSGGLCPERLTGIWLVMITSLIMLVSAFFPDIRLKTTK